MKIKVNFYAIFRQMAGGKTFEIEVPNDATIRDLLEAIRNQISEEIYKKILAFMESERIGILILVNGRNIVHLNGLDTEIKEKDKIDIFPPGAGGA
ncbi:MAG: ubiquitin-like small modifier protein 1 [Candidatus Njordarchaeia archaeon]